MIEPFKLIVADSPWLFGDSLPGETRGASNQYPCLTTRELCRFPLPPIDDNAVLLLWRVAAMQQEALDVTRMWGFTVKTEFVWLKKTVNGKRWFGMGRTLRAEHEVCLVATRGKPKLKNHSTYTTFVTDFEGLSATVGRHSEKPERFYQIVEELFEGPYCELFARRQRVGWTCMGNEVNQEVSS